MMLGAKYSLVPAPERTQVGLRYNGLPVEVQITSGRIAVMIFSAKDPEQGLTLQKCAMYPTKQVGAIPFAFIVVESTTFQPGVTTKPNDNREEPRSTPRDLRECGPNNSHNRGNQPQVIHHQTRFDKGLNRQYSPNYVNYHQSPLESIPGRDLSTTLMELANIQSRSLEMMAASQRSQHKSLHELTRASKDKTNDTMFASIKVFKGRNRQAFEDWINKIDQACRVK